MTFPRGRRRSTARKGREEMASVSMRLEVEAPSDEASLTSSGSARTGGPEPEAAPAGARAFGLAAGPALFLLLRLLPPPGSLPPEGWATAAVLVLMACWWLTEAVPIPVTALLPLVLFPVLGLSGMQEAAAPYANELIFLFMGGFFMAAAMERWDVHRRIALAILVRVGTSPPRVLLGFMTATAFISMWINNTATAAMMLPIALAVGAMFRPPVEPGADARPYSFGIALMLGIAYASSIGGVGTLIGTPPNALFAAAAPELAGIEIGFFEWMLVGVPVAGVMLPLTWLILTRVYPPGELRGDVADLLEGERARLGPMSAGQRFVATVFGLTVAAWILRAPKEMGGWSIPGIATWVPGLTDATIAMIAAVALMAVPYDPRRASFALDWGTASRIPWGVLLLFGGGLSLAEAMTDTGLAAWIGGGVANLGGVPPVVLVGSVATLFIFLTEVTSNTAVAAMAMPVLAGVALGLGIPPVLLMATAAVGCSMAFMLPAGTPPNAIVFSSGYLTVAQMAWAGIWINLLSITVVTAAAVTLVPLVLGP